MTILLNGREPEFLQRAQQAANPVIEINGQHGIRRSVLLTDIPSAETVLSQPCSWLSENLDTSEWCCREQAINTAAIKVLSLQGLRTQEYLYALGILLAAAGQTPENEVGNKKIIEMPNRLALLARNGELQSSLAEHAGVSELQKALIHQLASLPLPWTTLAHDAYPINFPMHVSLLMLHDDTSAVKSLTSAWQQFSQDPQYDQMLSAYLSWRIYHDLFPSHATCSPEDIFLQLSCDYYQLRSLMTLWIQVGHTLTLKNCAMLVSLFECWRGSKKAQAERHVDMEPFANDRFLAAFSLLPL